MTKHIAYCFPLTIGLIVLLAMCRTVSGAEGFTLSEKSEQANFSLVTVADGLDFAWDIEFLPNGDLLLSEYDGRLRLLPHAQAEGQQVIEAITDVTERGGLAGIAAHPNFASTGWLYFCYATGSADANHTRISRARFDGRQVSGMQTVFDADNTARELAHYGCRLLWLPDGSLIATFGDRRHHASESQQLNDHYGTVIRINDDGSAAADNPFVATKGARPEIWAYGLRNVEGAAFHPQTGELWVSEHGPLGGDEINVLRPGRNYGWPIATYGIDYDGTVLTDTPLRPEVEAPLFYWYPSIAPSSVAFYSGADFPKWQNDLFVTTLASRRLLRLELIGDRIVRVEELLSELDVRLRDVSMGPDGKLYLLTDAGDGRLLRFEPTPGQ